MFDEGNVVTILEPNQPRLFPAVSEVCDASQIHRGKAFFQPFGFPWSKRKIDYAGVTIQLCIDCGRRKKRKILGIMTLFLKLRVFGSVADRQYPGTPTARPPTADPNPQHLGLIHWGVLGLVKIGINIHANWKRGQDLNLQPSRYERDALPRRSIE
jgi:hypothetical protein